MKYFLVLALLLGCQLHAEEDPHTRLVHDLAHGMGGVIIASAAHGIDSMVPDWTNHRWGKVLSEIGIAMLGNVAYMAVTEKPLDISVERTLAAGFGAALFSFQVNF